MAREDITFADIFSAIWRQANEDEVEGVFRLHILRFWSRDRTTKFCLHLLGDEAQEWWANREGGRTPLAQDGVDSPA